MQKVLIYGMTHNPGGIENYILNIKKQLASQIQMDFITHFKDMAFKETLKSDGSKVYYVPGKSTGILRHIRLMKRFFKVHKEYSVIYFNIMDTRVVITMLIAYFSKCKIVVHSHNGGEGSSMLHKFLRLILNRIVNQRMACSENAAAYMFGEKYLTETVVIHNKVDVRKYQYNASVRSAKRRELGVEDRFVMCHVGRLMHQKNPKGLIDIMQEVHKTEPKALLLSIGDGDMAAEARNYARHKNLDKDILFMGVRKDIAELMQAADVFVLPSFYEGLPIVGIEAQTAGLLCVFSDQVTREADVTGNCRFCKLENKEKWRETILEGREFARADVSNAIIEAGYSLKEPKDTMILLKCLSKGKN